MQDQDRTPPQKEKLKGDNTPDEIINIYPDISKNRKRTEKDWLPAKEQTKHMSYKTKEQNRLKTVQKII